MTQIAAEAGVSVGLVSRLLRGDPTLRITDERRKSILRVRDNLGGLKARRVTGSAGGIGATRRRVLTRTIIVPVSRDHSPAWVHAHLASSQIIRNLEAALGEQDFQLHYTYYDESNRHAFYQSLVENGRTCDGILLLSGASDQWLADLLRQHQVPHVSSDFAAEQFRLNTVRAHTWDGFRQAVAHLCQLGHERIGFLGATTHYRYPLVVATVSAAGLSSDSSNHCLTQGIGVGDPEDRYRQLAAEAVNLYLQRRGPKATALIAANDRYAMGAIDALQRAGLVPGKDLSIVGHDNLECRGAEPVKEPVLTTIDNPYDLIGRRMAELLLNQIEHRQTQIVHERIPVDLIVRQTTGRAR